MSRAAVLAALRNDATLNAIVPANNIIPNYSKEGRPANLSPGPFLILRWGDQRAERAVGGRGPRDLVIWAHYPTDKSTDFDDVDEILAEVDRVLLAIDDDTVTDISPAGGKSGDLTDPAFDTIVRNVAYEVLSRT